jgi:hypothetical protein
MAWEDAFWEINKEITELKLKKKFDAQLEKMKWQDHHKYSDTRDQWIYARNKVVRQYHENKSKKAGK